MSMDLGGCYPYPWGAPLRTVMSARLARKGSRAVILRLGCGHESGTRVRGWLHANLPSKTPLHRCKVCPPTGVST